MFWPITAKSLEGKRRRLCIKKSRVELESALKSFHSKPVFFLCYLRIKLIHGQIKDEENLVLGRFCEIQAVGHGVSVQVGVCALGVEVGWGEEMQGEVVRTDRGRTGCS